MPTRTGGPPPRNSPLFYGGLIARCRALLFGSSSGLPDPLLDIPLIQARRLIHGLFLVPQARHLRLLLPQASIGSHDRPVFAILVPRAGDRPAGEQWSGRGRCAQREHQGLPLRQQPRRLQPQHAKQWDERLTPQRSESIERKWCEGEPSEHQEQATWGWVVWPCARSCPDG